MPKAVFLDRDGIINEHRDDYVKNLNELKILPNAAKAIKKLNDLNYLVIIITNQSVVNRRIITERNLSEINNLILKQMADSGAKIDSIYYCPHTPEQNCTCRKPKPGLILQAIKDYNLDNSKCLMIGDSESDIQAAKQANIQSLKMVRDGNLLEFINKNYHLLRD